MSETGHTLSTDKLPNEYDEMQNNLWKLSAENYQSGSKEQDNVHTKKSKEEKNSLNKFILNNLCDLFIEKK